MFVVSALLVPSTVDSEVESALRATDTVVADGATMCVAVCLAVCVIECDSEVEGALRTTDTTVSDGATMCAALCAAACVAVCVSDVATTFPSETRLPTSDSRCLESLSAAIACPRSNAQSWLDSQCPCASHTCIAYKHIY